LIAKGLRGYPSGNRKINFYLGNYKDDWKENSNSSIQAYTWKEYLSLG
jgi:hypothetical protein